MNGWIALHRQLKKHWLWEEKRTFSKAEAWIDILLMVNHADKKVPLGNELILVEKGQRIISIRQLCERWSWSNTKVKNFLSLLEKDGMLKVKSDSKKTLLTVVNYRSFQDVKSKKRHKSDAKTTQERHESDTKATREHTNNNDNNELTMNNNDNNTNQDSKNTEYRTAIDMLTRCGFGNISPNTYEDVKDWIDRLNVDLVLEAIKIADHAGKNFWNYPRAILRRWAQENLTTLEQVRAHEKKQNYKPKQENNYLGSSEYKPWGDLTTEKLIEQAKEEVKNMRITPDEEIDY